MIANSFLYQHPDFVAAIELIEEELGRILFQDGNSPKWIRFTNNHVFKHGCDELSAERLLNTYHGWRET